MGKVHQLIKGKFSHSLFTFLAVFMASSWVLDQPAFAATTPGFTYMKVFNGKPVRWEKCSSLTYKIAFSGISPNEAKNIQFALHKISEVTGIKFESGGSTKVIPQKASWPTAVRANTDILIAFATPTFGPYFSSVLTGDTKIAFGGPQGNGTSWSRAGVVIDKRIFTRWHLSVTQRRDLYMHELGHAVGLGHSSMSGNIMHPGSYPANSDWGRGDLQGLKNLRPVRVC